LSTRSVFPELPKEPGTNWAAVGAVLLVLLIVVGGIAVVSPGLPGKLLNDFSSLLGNIGSQIPQTTNSSVSTSQSGLSYTVYSPTINGTGGSTITFPADYGTLANYTLSVINQDRASYGLAPVTLSPIKSGQQHANSMLYFGYFSHIDTQGYKPYMRYSLLEGVGSMEENIAYEAWTGPHYTTISAVQQTLKQLEYQMMYNDSTCCNNGHRDNILTSLHNRVSIGIAFSLTTVYFVEDFENYYISLKFSVNPSHIVQFSGTPLKSPQTLDVAVYFDPTPTGETAAQLNAGGHEYDAGNVVGGVFPPCTIGCSYFANAVTVYANTWTVSSTQVDIQFPMDKFIQADGAGVYTLYLLTGNSTNSSLTSVSVFIGG
jgi:uncharacterized protein YkwD